MKYMVQVALTEKNGPESEFSSENMKDCQLLYRALRDAGHRPIRIIENGYWNSTVGQKTSVWVSAKVHWQVENGIESCGAPRPVT